MDDNIYNSPSPVNDIPPNNNSYLNTIYGFLTTHKIYILIAVISIVMLYFLYKWYTNSRKSDIKSKYIKEPIYDDDDVFSALKEDIINSTEHIENSENNISSDINKELAKIKAEENINISCQNLTNSEIEDINSKLNMIQK